MLRCVEIFIFTVSIRHFNLHHIIIINHCLSLTKERIFFQKVKLKMGLCDFCKVESKEKLKTCVCKKASYCSRECQAQDWKNHKPSCPPFIIRESPGKGRGLFATRKIKEGQIILDEYPLLALSGEISLAEFQASHYPEIDNETK